MTFHYKTALIIGGSRGVGRDLSIKLSEMGVRTVTVARNRVDLDSLKETVPSIETIAMDAAGDGVAEKLMAEISPDLLIMAGGHRPKMRSIAELSWQDFSATWKADTKIAFEFTKAAILAPMRAGGAIVSFSSGAALGGSPLSGGYAGAKRMQHFVSNYGKWDADQRGLGLNFYTIYPKQLIAGTSIANDASSAYAAARSVSQEQFMNQWEKPLTVEIISDHVIDLLADESGGNAGAYTISGTAMEAFG
jgi:NAD(P)-dependent dehydrogenase (short-subunit alcohol dehydrogenase family)